MATLKGADYDIDKRFNDTLVKTSIHEAFDFVSQVSKKGIHSDADMTVVAETGYEISSALCKEYGDEIAYAFDKIMDELMHPEKF